jgi:Domain of unknown function (DUF4124)
MKMTAFFARRRPGAMLLLACLALGLAASAQAQWKWRDKGGQIHVSDLPPPHAVPDKDILQRPTASRFAAQAASAASAAAPAASAAGVAAPASVPGDNKLAAEVEARRVKAQEEEKARRKAVEEANVTIRADNCQRARRSLVTLESGQRIARTNDKGEREILDDKARAEETQRARRIVASDCK